MKQWIRPVYVGERLVSLALCRTNGTILVDEQIIEHYPADEPGIVIKSAAKEFHGATEVDWGLCINNKE